jgi:hypothetical protein
MAEKTYYEKLKDPRWQKVRLQAMEKANFCCQMCFDDSTSLNVHHKEYFKGHEPWEYNLNQLIVLCEDCHKNHHAYKDMLKKISSYLDYDGPNDRTSIAFMIAGYCNFDYDSLFAETDCEDCACFRAFYDLGLKVRDIHIDFRGYIKMYEDKENG